MGRDDQVGIRVRGNTLTNFVVGNKRELERLNVYYANPLDYRLNTGPFYRKCGKKNRGLVHHKTHCATVPTVLRDRFPSDFPIQLNLNILITAKYKWLRFVKEKLDEKR